MTMTTSVQSFDLDTATVLEQMTELSVYVQQCTADEADDLYTRAKVAKEWIKIHKGATEIANAAIRLECWAVRRIYQLVGDDIQNSLRAAGKRFAAMDDGEFSDMLTKYIPRSGTAIGIHRQISKDEIDRWRVGREDRLRNGYVTDDDEAEILHDDFDSSWRWASRTMYQSATDLLTALYETGEAFTVDEAAIRLAKELDLSPGVASSFAAKELIRYAARSEAIMAPTDTVGRPNYPYGRVTFVTYETDDLGWVRVPWHSATIDQLRFMVRYRREQADQLAVRADELDAILAQTEKIAAKHPDETRLVDLAKYSGGTL